LPQLDSGAYAIKRIIGQKVVVTADVFSDGHDVLQSCKSLNMKMIKNGKKLE
jgi:starch synthase (maltosyl-transferring)